VLNVPQYYPYWINEIPSAKWGNISIIQSATLISSASVILLDKLELQLVFHFPSNIYIPADILHLVRQNVALGNHTNTEHWVKQIAKSFVFVEPRWKKIYFCWKYAWRNEKENIKHKKFRPPTSIRTHVNCRLRTDILRHLRVQQISTL